MACPLTDICAQLQGSWLAGLGLPADGHLRPIAGFRASLHPAKHRICCQNLIGTSCTRGAKGIHKRRRDDGIQRTMLSALRRRAFLPSQKRDIDDRASVSPTACYTISHTRPNLKQVHAPGEVQTRAAWLSTPNLKLGDSAAHAPGCR